MRSRVVFKTLSFFLCGKLGAEKIIVCAKLLTLEKLIDTFFFLGILDNPTCSSVISTQPGSVPTTNRPSRQYLHSESSRLAASP